MALSAIKWGTPAQPAMQAGLKCDHIYRKHPRFPEVPFFVQIASMDIRRDEPLESASMICLRRGPQAVRRR
jgi:hypothetical protein